MLLEALKSDLERLYEIDVPLLLGDFLITDRELIGRIAADPPADTQEALYLIEDGEHTGMALYIDEAVVRRLAADDPRDALHEGNLADFCVALEGVSHFTYVAWRASHDRSVTQLELEMQAEVDKFATSTMLLGQQCAGRIPPDLARRLFGNVSFLPGLDAQSRERYERANDYAGRFCEGLTRRHMRAPGSAAMTRELRRFYRLDQRQKIKHIEAAL